MLYFYDYDVIDFPNDAETIIDLRNWEYWTLTPGEDIQCYITEHKLVGDGWRVLSKNPSKYTTLIAKRRFV